MQFCYATLNFDERSHYSLSTCWIYGYTCKTPIIAHIALEQGTWFWLLTAARYIALSLISRYLSLDPNYRDISGLHCTIYRFQYINIVVTLPQVFLTTCNENILILGESRDIVVLLAIMRFNGVMSYSVDQKTFTHWGRLVCNAIWSSQHWFR